MTARIIDGKAIAADLRGKVTRRRAPSAARPRPGAGPRRGAGRRESGERSLCPQQIQGGRRSRHAAVRPASCRRPRAKPSCSSWSRRLNADPSVNGILVQLPLPPQIDHAKGDRGHRSGQGRRRLPSAQCRPPRQRPAGAGAVHAARLHAAGQDRACVARRPGGGGDRPLQHRRQAGGAIAAGRERDGDDGAFARRAICRRVPPRRSAGRRDRPAGDGARRLDQAGRDRDRRRHQPRRGRGRQSRASSATSASPRPSRSPARSRRCPAASAR